MARFYGRARGVVMGLGRRLGGIPGGPGLATRKPPPVSGGGFHSYPCCARPFYGTSVLGSGDQTQ